MEREGEGRLMEELGGEGRVAVREYIKKEVGDWDDDLVARSRFKAFSGQFSDWESTFLFWRHLILNVSGHFQFLFIRPSQLKKDWFNRGGLSPLCLEQVLSLMHKERDILPTHHLVDPRTGRLSHILTKLTNLFFTTTNTSYENAVFIVMPVLKEKAARLVKLLADENPSPSSTCVITINRFDHISASPQEASAILSYLSSQSQARFLSLSLNGNTPHIIQGVKVSLSASPVSSVSSLDCDVLHLISTTETLEQQLAVIDKRCQSSKKAAMASLASGNKNVALRHLRTFKLVDKSREKCASLLSRVEEVLLLISNAESTKKVSEAIQVGAQAIKENNISVKEVEHSLQQLEESVDLQKQVEYALESTPSYTSVDNEDIEEEFKKLELEIGCVNNSHQPIHEAEAHAAAAEATALDSAESLSEAFSNLKVVDVLSSTAAARDIAAKETKDLELERA